MRWLCGLSFRLCLGSQSALWGGVEPLQGSSSRGPCTQGARPVVATLGWDVSPPSGCRGCLDGGCVLADG